MSSKRVMIVRLHVCVFDRHMSGPSDNDFYGSLRGNVTYHMGPGYHQPQLNWYIDIYLTAIYTLTGEINAYFGNCIRA